MRRWESRSLPALSSSSRKGEAPLPPASFPPFLLRPFCFANPEAAPSLRPARAGACCTREPGLRSCSRGALLQPSEQARVEPGLCVVRRGGRRAALRQKQWPEMLGPALPTRYSGPAWVGAPSWAVLGRGVVSAGFRAAVTQGPVDLGSLPLKDPT